MICQFHHGGTTSCRAWWVEVRHVRLPTGDTIAVLLCQPHADAFDAIEWAERRRDNAAGA